MALGLAYRNRWANGQEMLDVLARVVADVLDYADTLVAGGADAVLERAESLD